MSKFFQINFINNFYQSFKAIQMKDKNIFLCFNLKKN
jgi:hypothetical protein